MSHESPVTKLTKLPPLQITQDERHNYDTSLHLVYRYMEILTTHGGSLSLLVCGRKSTIVTGHTPI